MEDYKENLKTYIKEDIIYQEYLKNKNKNFSDFDKFCIQHCKDIEELLEENEKLKAELQLYQGALKRENEAIHRVNELEEVIDKAIDLIETFNFTGKRLPFVQFRIKIKELLRGGINE